MWSHLALCFYMMLLHWLKGIDKLGHTSTTLNFRCLMKNLVGFEVSFKTKMVQLIGIVAFQTEEKYLTEHTHTHAHFKSIVYPMAKIALGWCFKKSRISILFFKMH